MNNLGVWDRPCRALDSEGPVHSRGISDMIDNLLKKTEDVRILSQQLKQYVSSFIIIIIIIVIVVPVLNCLDKTKTEIFDYSSYHCFNVISRSTGERCNFRQNRNCIIKNNANH